LSISKFAKFAVVVVSTNRGFRNLPVVGAECFRATLRLGVGSLTECFAASTRLRRLSDIIEPGQNFSTIVERLAEDASHILLQERFESGAAKR
jgi:hypothetical protein